MNNHEFSQYRQLEGLDHTSYQQDLEALPTALESTIADVRSSISKALNWGKNLFTKEYHIPGTQKADAALRGLFGKKQKTADSSTTVAKEESTIHELSPNEEIISNYTHESGAEVVVKVLKTSPEGILEHTPQTEVKEEAQPIDAILRGVVLQELKDIFQAVPKTGDLPVLEEASNQTPSNIVQFRKPRPKTAPEINIQAVSQTLIGKAQETYQNMTGKEMEEGDLWNKLNAFIHSQVSQYEIPQISANTNYPVETLIKEYNRHIIADPRLGFPTLAGLISVRQNALANRSHNNSQFIPGIVEHRRMAR